MNFRERSAGVSRLTYCPPESVTSMQGGKDDLVTDMGEPAAKFIAPPPEAEGEVARMERLERLGIVRRGTGKFPAGFWDLRRA